MEQRTKPDHLEKEKQVVLSGDEYEEKCQSITLNGSSCQSNPMEETKVSSLHYKENQKGVCSSATSKMDNDANLFDYLEPIISFEEKIPIDSKQLQLELPKLSMDCVFSEQIETAYSLLPASSPLEIPFY
jgi:hypothetical protein